MSMLKNQNRWRNKGLWVSLIAAIPAILGWFGFLVIPETWGAVEEVLMAIVSLLVVLGILNNPTTDTTGYNDDNEGETK